MLEVVVVNWSSGFRLGWPEYGCFLAGVSGKLNDRSGAHLEPRREPVGYRCAP